MSVNIDQSNFHTEVICSDETVLLDFYASWCGPCRTLAPILEEISQEHSDIKVCKINVDEQAQLAKQFEIKGIPTLISMKHGNILSRCTGVKRKHEILAML